jgi:long-chain fatty acid transport protein
MQFSSANIQGSVIAILTSVCVSQTFAGGLILYEIGSDDVGLAAAGYSARAQDPSTILTNPAGMTRLANDQFFVGAQALYEDIEFTPINASPFLGNNDGDNPIGVFPGGSLFYSYSVSDAFKAGIGIYGNFGLALAYDGDWVGRYTAVKGTLIGASVQPTLAYRFSNGLSLGAGPVIMYGIFKANTRINNTPFQIFNFADGELKLSDDDWGIGANLGALYEFNERTRLGLTYTSGINLDFSPSAGFSDLSPILDTVLRNRGIRISDVDINIKVPQGVMGSIFHQMNPCWALLMSAGWQEWSTFGQVQVDITSTNPVSLSVETQFKDTWHGAVGLQHRLAQKWLLNFGIGYDSIFQNTSNISLAVPGNSAWRYGIGSKYETAHNADLGLAFEYVYGGTLDVNSHSLVTGDLTGQFKHVSIYFLALNATWK